MDPKDCGSHFDHPSPSGSKPTLIKASTNSETNTYNFHPLLSEVLASVEPSSATGTAVARPVGRESEQQLSSLVLSSTPFTSPSLDLRLPYARPGTLLTSLRQPRLQQSSPPATSSNPPPPQATSPIHPVTMDYTSSGGLPGRSPSPNGRRVRFADLSLEDEPSTPQTGSPSLIGPHPNTQPQLAVASPIEELAGDAFEQWISVYRTIPLGSCHRRTTDSDGALLIALMQQRQGNGSSLEDKAVELKQHLDRLCASGHLSREVAERLGMSPEGSLVLFDGTELPSLPSRPSDPPQPGTMSAATAGGSPAKASRTNGSSNCHIEVVINNSQQ